MKKSLIFAVLFASGVAAALPAQDFSAGAGVLYSAQFDGGYSTAAGYTHYPVSGFGGFLFFDASYVEVSAGVFFGTMEVEQSRVPREFGSLTSVNIGALGKYPIEMNGFILYPLFGLEYDMSISAKNIAGISFPDASQFSALWFKGGIGADFDIADSIYLRGQFLYGARLANQYEKDNVEPLARTGAKTVLGHGLNIKLALGYKF